MKKLFSLSSCMLLLVTSLFSQTVPQKEENSVRIMSYNIRNCIGIDNQMDMQRITAAINEAVPDIVAIQEVDSAATRTNGRYVLGEVAAKVLMHPTFAPAIDFQGGKYGVGLLSKEPPLSVKHIPLPGKTEKRVLLVAEFNKYVVCCTHFALDEDDRKESVGIIVDALKGFTKPVFLAGDMNSFPESPEQELLRKHFVTLNNLKQNTFPSDTPRECIDYIYGFNNAGNTYSVLGRNVLTNRIGSDHLPVYVDTRLKADKDDIFRTKPYLQNPTNNGITVSWFTNVPVYAWVEYGVNGQLDKRKELYVDGQMICNNKHHKMRLTDLEPGKTYSYRVCSREITLYQAYKKEFGETAYSDVYTFTMPSEQTKDFTAIILNDIHKNKKLMDMIGDVIGKTGYDMVFFNGDWIDDPKDEQEALSFLTYMNDRVKATNVPVFYMRGNHEIRNAYSIELRNLIDYAGDKTYSSFNWGDTRFVLLDCGEDKPDSTWVYYGLNNFEGLRMDQAKFLKKELNEKAFKKANKRVLIHHIPIYGMRPNSYNPCLELWGGLLTKAPFNVSINGHTHRYAYHAKGSVGNNFPVVIGGGNKPDTATVMILRKKGNKMTLSVLTSTGESKLELEL
jgi:Metal-dependent hydrolase